jgi:tRNA-2-methylthio-N6-dimethylallyladenosine synthase
MSAGKVYAHAFGCQMNKLDAELVLGELLRKGYEQTADMDEADVILFLTCSVREHAEHRVYSNVGKLKFLKQTRPHVIIGILGCMAQKDQNKIFRKLPHVDLVCGTREFPRIAELIEQARMETHVLACDEDASVSPDRFAPARPSAFQAFVSIMRGCDNFCSYCIVPYVRGREISREPGEIVDEVKKLVDDGVVEVTLLGQNVNSYGKSFGKKDALADLLHEVGEIDGLLRLRFVTSHPKDMARPILEAMRDVPKVCEYLHMPAQSGSDRILKLMHRQITNARYRDLVALARDLVPGISIASDFIVGFPTETAEEYEETATLVRDLEFANSFVFKYSPRSGTRAAQMDDDVPVEEKKRRNADLLSIQMANNGKVNASMIGSIVNVLVEGPSKRDLLRLTSRAPTNHIVVFPHPDTLTGQIVPVKITDATEVVLVGERVQ